MRRERGLKSPLAPLCQRGEPLTKMSLFPHFVKGGLGGISRSISTKRECGIALITVLLIVALAVSTAAFMAWQQQLEVRRMENLRDQAQAGAIARAAVDWARAILADDARDNNVDHLDENWATALKVLPVEQGQIAGGITDQQGLFNLNNLSRGEEDIAAFRRLLNLLRLPTELADAAADWVDANTELRQPGGAEDAYYLSLEPPYRAANRPLSGVDGLFRVKGFDRETVEKLRPFVTALPQPTPVNVNTAPAEVLAAFFPELTLESAQAMVEVRKKNYFKDQADFRGRMPAGQSNQMRDTIFSVNSNYFLVTGRASFGRVRLGWQALLQRRGNAWPVVLWRKVL
jgi:general secretion pathway protein K